MSTLEAIMSTPGDIMSTPGDIMSTPGGYHEYTRGCSVYWVSIQIQLFSQ